MKLTYQVGDLVVKSSKISVELTHVDLPKILVEAWKTSRPDAKITGKTLYEILKLDLPVNELVHFTMTCKVPVILRELLTTLRDHIMWAKTSRVDNITKYFEVYERGLESKELCENLRGIMQTIVEQSEDGIPQDSFRKYLPLSYMTSFTCKISLRSLGKFLCHLKWISDNYKPLKDLFDDFYLAIDEELVKFSMETRLRYGQYLEREIAKPHINYNEFNDFANDSVISNSSFVAMNISKVPIGLRAQLVRSRSINICDNLLDAFMKRGWKSDNTMSLKVSICSTRSFLSQLVSKRNCWLAQKDLWSPILKLLNKELGDKVVLPCTLNGGKCPVYKDCMERLIGSDPGVPCPMHYLLHKDVTMKEKPMTKKLSDVMINYAERTDRCMSLKVASQQTSKLYKKDKS